jgi:hypothetical protein
MIRQRERVMLRRGVFSPSALNTGLSRTPKYADRRVLSGVTTLLDVQRTHGNAFVQRLVQRKLAISTATCAIARQPNPLPDPGWSDAPDKGFNKWVTTVDERGNIVPGKATSKGVWRVPVQGLSHGLQKVDKGPAFESSEGRAVALIPNTVTPTAAEKKDNVPVDVLLHLHGYGVGYRELRPGKLDYAKVLQPGQARDVELYQMEQQLLSHVAASKRLIIAVLPQGSETSGFGDLGSNSDAYLKEVFAKLVPKYLPEGAFPGRVIVSGHSGGGPTAMKIAAKAGKRRDVFLFDAINFGCIEKEPVLKDGKPVTNKDGSPKMKCKEGSACASKEFDTVKSWVRDKIKADVQSLDGKPEGRQPTELQANGTRFRGFTSESLATKNTCSYGFWYNKLKTDIESTISKLKVSQAVADQLRQNYQVREVQGPHERVMGQGNLEAALKD